MVLKTNSKTGYHSTAQKRRTSSEAAKEVKKGKPNAGNINMYTSGCPKNQNKCWK
jgi:hypothetical protein